MFSKSRLDRVIRGSSSVLSKKATARELNIIKEKYKLTEDTDAQCLYDHKKLLLSEARKMKHAGTRFYEWITKTFGCSRNWINQKLQEEADHFRYDFDLYF